MTTNDTAKIADIQAFWNQQADQYKDDLKATTPDPLAKQLELAAIRRALPPGPDVLEVGCGNGFNLFGLADHFQGRLNGIDYAASMIEVANRSRAGRADADRFTFSVGSVLELDLADASVPQLFTVRCLINLPNPELQAEGLAELARVVKPGGRLALIESTQDGQEKLNAMRAAVGLTPIPYHWHNLYLRQAEFLANAPANLRLIEVDDFASLYFVASRVFNAKMTPEGQAPDYLAEVNKIAAALPSMGDCGPLKLFLFEKVGP